MTDLEARAQARNAHPNVLPHAATVEDCDQLCALAEKNVVLRLPTYAASRATAVSLEDLPTPTLKRFLRHAEKFGADQVWETARDCLADGQTVAVVVAVPPNRDSSSIPVEAFVRV